MTRHEEEDWEDGVDAMQWTAPHRGISERARFWLWVARLALIAGYAAIAWFLGHNSDPVTGTELAFLTVLAVWLVAFILAAGKVLGGQWRD